MLRHIQIGRAVRLSIWGSRCVARGHCRGSGQGKILSFSRSRPGSPHKAQGSAFTLARVLATLVRGGSPLTRMNALPCQGRVYPCQSCQGRVKILLCPGETLPCEGKEFIHCQGRLGRTPSWLWWDFLVTNPPGRDRILILDLVRCCMLVTANPALGLSPAQNSTAQRHGVYPILRRYMLYLAVM